MKAIKIFMLLLLAATVTGLSAQKKTKVGTVNSQEILTLMPEYDSIQKVYQQRYNQMQAAGEQMMQEYQQKQQYYVAHVDSMTDLVRSIKEQELKDLGNRIQTFQDNAQQQLQQLINDLQKPIIDKIKQAIEQVAKENGYTQIVDLSTGILLYYDESLDITKLVKTKLGLKDKPAPSTLPAGQN